MYDVQGVITPFDRLDGFERNVQQSGTADAPPGSSDTPGQPLVELSLLLNQCKTVSARIDGRGRPD